MTTHRCGMPDLDAGLAFSVRCSWPNPHLTYAFEDGTGDVAGNAELNSANDFSVVTRAAQDNDSQRWIFAPVGIVCTLRQRSNGRFVDAHEVEANDFAAVTRPDQNNDTQRWIVMPDVAGSFTMRQLSSGRFLDAHESQPNDFGVVTRGPQGDDTQRWLLDAV